MISSLLVLCCADLPGPASAAMLATSELAAQLSTRGLAVVRHQYLTPDIAEQAASQSAARLDSLLEEVQAAGADPIEQHYTFAEFSHRQRMRWDLRMPDDDPVWRSVCNAAIAGAKPILQRIHPASPIRMLMSGVLISRPGAGLQRWHADADSVHFQRAADDQDCRIYNAFMPRMPCDFPPCARLCLTPPAVRPYCLRLGFCKNSNMRRYGPASVHSDRHPRRFGRHTVLAWFTQ